MTKAMKKSYMMMQRDLAAFKYYAELVTKHDVSVVDFMDKGEIAFKAGRAAMHIDGSFVLSTFGRARKLEYGITELPEHNGIKANFSSYWVNGITSKASGEKRIAAEKFLKFITSANAMQLWLDQVGELPAKISVAKRAGKPNTSGIWPVYQRVGLCVYDKFLFRKRTKKDCSRYVRPNFITGNEC